MCWLSVYFATQGFVQLGFCNRFTTTNALWSYTSRFRGGVYYLIFAFTIKVKMKIKRKISISYLDFSYIFETKNENSNKKSVNLEKPDKF